MEGVVEDTAGDATGVGCDLVLTLPSRWWGLCEEVWRTVCEDDSYHEQELLCDDGRAMRRGKESAGTRMSVRRKASLGLDFTMPCTSCSAAEVSSERQSQLTPRWQVDHPERSRAKRESLA